MIGRLIILPEKGDAMLRSTEYTLSDQSDKRICRSHVWITLFVILAIEVACATPYAFGAETPTAGTTFRDCANCPEMVVIPNGDFLMGLSDTEWKRDVDSSFTAMDKPWQGHFLSREQPQHAVHVSAAFALGKYPVTREEFAAFIADSGYDYKNGCYYYGGAKIVFHLEGGWQHPEIWQSGRSPVVCVSWGDSQAYLAWLNKRVSDDMVDRKSGSYRLPSDAEWEYAARAGQSTTRWWGDDIGRNNAVCSDCGSHWDKLGTPPVGSFPANLLGLFDMLGNVSELIEDCWHDNYKGAPTDASPWLSTGCNWHVVRGASWRTPPMALRTTVRNALPLYDRFNTIGFRVAKNLQ